MQVILSLFPGMDLFGRAFEHEGACVVRGPDKLLGQDIVDFHAPPGRFDAIIGGSPCQDFSKARRVEPTGDGVRMIQEFSRVVLEAQPEWWLLENVEGVPDVLIGGYSHQRIPIHATEAGVRQNRMRHFQFGHRDGLVLCVDRPITRKEALQDCVVASKTNRAWEDACELQGLPRDFQLNKLLSNGGRYRVLGNGVPIPVGILMARACAHPVDPLSIRLCACGCARPVSYPRSTAGAACRKRIERASKHVTHRGTVASAWSPAGITTIYDDGAALVTLPASTSPVPSQAVFPIIETHVQTSLML